MKKLAAFFDRLNNVLAGMGAVILVLLMLSVCYAVVIRYLFNMSTPGMFEIWEYSILYITLLGAAWLLKKDGHVSMDIVISNIKPKTQSILNFITSSLGAIMFFLLTWFGAEATARLFREGTRIPGDLYPPAGLIVIIIPIGSFLLFVQLLRKAYHCFTVWQALSDKEPQL